MWVALRLIIILLLLTFKSYSEDRPFNQKNFVIKDPITSDLILISPNGGEIWEPGTTEFIKWYCSESINIKIEFSTDNGTNWNIIYSSISSTSDSIIWIIPNTPSQRCLIKISDVSNNSFADTSDFIFSITAGGWLAQNSGTTEHLTRIDFINDTVGYCISYGTILKTIDGGQTWNNIYNNPSQWLISLSFKDENFGVIVGNEGLLMLTTNGGNNWNTLNVGTTKKLNAIFFIDEFNGWIAGDDGTILKTIDGGYNWDLFMYPQYLHLYAISFVNLNDGWMTGKNGKIIKTTDGGVSWVEQNSNTNEYLYTVDFVDHLYGWVAGYNGVILHTTNGGNSWISQNSGTLTWLEDIEFINRDTGWVCGWYGKLLKTKNGGDFWSVQSVPSTANLQAISFPNDINGWMCGYNGGIFHYTAGITGLNLISPEGGEYIKSSTLYSIKWLSNNIDSIKIEFSSDGGDNWEILISKIPANVNSFIWQVPANLSEQCIIKLTDLNNPDNQAKNNNYFSIVDSGWFIQDISTGNNLNNIYFISQDSGWIAGNGGIIFATTNSGSSWLPQESNLAENLSSIFFVDPLFGWTTGKSGKLAKTSDGGISWVEANTNTNQDLNSVFFIDRQLGWIAGNNGSILKTTNGGNDWFPLPVPDNHNYKSIYFIDSNNGDAVNNDGAILKTTDGGNNWTAIYTIPPHPLNYIYFAGEYYGYAVGAAATIKQTMNGGLNWYTLSNEENKSYNSVHFIHPSTGWIVGSSGIIIHTSNYGNTWQQYQSGVLKNLNSVFFSKPNIGWACGENGILLKYLPPRSEILTILTPNGGENLQNGNNYSISWISTDIENVKIEYSVDNGSNWVQLTNSIPASVQNFEWSVPNSPTIQGLIRISDASDDSIYDLSDTTFAISTEQFGWIKLPISTGKSLNSIHFENENLGWVTGLDGIIIKTTDGGYNWEYQNSGTNNALIKIYFINEFVGWCIGMSDIVLKTTNGGDYWFAQQNNITSPIISASFVNENEGKILCSDGRIYNTSNGGSNWIMQTQLPLGIYYAIYFVNPTLGFVGGYSTQSYESIIFRTIDGGANWTVSYLNASTFPVLSLEFVDENYGFGVGINGVIMKTSNGGENWSVLTEGFNHSLFSISAVTSDFVWAVGEKGTILHTFDGYHWTEQISGTIEKFNSIQMVNHMVGYIITESGNVFKTNDGGVLPVELINFYSEIINNVIYLKWTTVSETNNQGFQVERRKTLYERSEDWNNIGFVNGNGTTTELQSYSYVDENLEAGKYQFRLKQINYDGTFEYSKTIEVEIGTPTKFSLEQNYPNPFNPITNIQYAIGSKQTVALKIYDVLGREVATLVNEEKPAGSYKVQFNVAQESFPALSSGIYFYQLKAGEYIETKKMILMK